MAGRLRSSGATLALTLALAAPMPASASEAWTCWSATMGGENGQTHTVTRCRLGGSERVEDYGSSTEVPVRLSPDVGVTGSADPCWYWTTRATDWVLLGVDDALVATLGIDPDGLPGGPIVTSADYPVCTSEPTDEPTPLAAAYELLAQYTHPTPEPRLDPPVGSGLAGLPTHVALTTPDPWTASLTSPLTGVTVEVETRVAAVEIDWGDGDVDVVPGDAVRLLTGWPDGAFGHTYETKTCAEVVPGCHPTLAAYPIVVANLWQARFRVDGGPWQPIPVPPTSWTVDYDVDEIRGVTTDVD